MSDNVSHLPGDQSIDLDLDAYERPADEVIPDFVFKLGGRVIVMTNPDTIDWKDLLDITNPVQFLRHSCSAEDRTWILSQKMEGFRFNKLMEAYQVHFRIDEKIEAARQAERTGLR